MLMKACGALLVLWTIVEKSSGLFCYTCDSKNTKTCDDPFAANTTSTNCTILEDQGAACMKIVAEYTYVTAELPYSSVAGKVVSRGCVSIPSDLKEDFSYKCTHVTAGSGSSSECFCDSDNCNTGSSVSVSLVTLFGLTLASSVLLPQH